jgi:5-methylcytosine-specific restriction endonuclease McrA
MVAKNKILCLNCDREIKKAELYCSDSCKDEAKFVRYVRRCEKDGRANKPDVKEAIEFRLAHILSGGYPERERTLPAIVRAKIISKAEGKCKKCGKPGNQIDHIKGSSNQIKNLQLLCIECHNKKTRESLRPLTPDSENWLESNFRIIALMERIESKIALRICDDDDEWPKEWRNLLKEREESLKN